MVSALARAVKPRRPRVDEVGCRRRRVRGRPVQGRQTRDAWASQDIFGRSRPYVRCDAVRSVSPVAPPTEAEPMKYREARELASLRQRLRERLIADDPDGARE